MDTFVRLNINDLVDCVNNSEFKVNYAPHNHVKDEFEKFVNKEISERRKHSSISLLRNFHNLIKRTLLENIVKVYLSKHHGEKIYLLDIACGRGGDIFKYDSAGITGVFAFDKSRDSIESINPFNQGARERYKKNKLHVDIHFDVGNAIQPTPELIKKIGTFINKNKIPGFQILSCQFAMHYFFESEIALRNVLSVFSQFLRKGGYFIGTTVDGKKITQLLQKNNSFDSTLLHITKKYRAITPRIPFGNKYIFTLNDSIDQGNYFNTMGESTEYLVNCTVLKQIAAEYNLLPVYINLFENKYTTHSDFVSFEEIYTLLNKQLSQNEIIINNLYTTFIFVKI
jgi:mRNA (guanine-N7-)-methyltransferase